MSDPSSVRRDVRVIQVATTAILHGIGLSCTSSQSPWTTKSPPVRGRPGGHDGNGRPLVPSFLRHSMCVRADLAALDR